MEEIKKIINTFSLKSDEKESLTKLLTTKKIYDIIILQEKAYISLESGQMIVLNNTNKELKKCLEKIKYISQKNFIEAWPRKRERTKIILWSDEDIEYLKSNYNDASAEKLSECLNKSIYQIEAKKMSLRLYPIKSWCSSELVYLKNNINDSLYELSKELNRSIASIKAKKRTILKQIQKT